MARRRNRKKLRPGQVCTLILAAAVVAAAAYFLITNYLFVVRSIAVQLPEGARFTQQQAAQQSGLKLGARMDRIDEAAIAQQLAGTGWLELEDVRLEYPSHVELVVSQRKPAALVSHVSTVLVTDADGVVIEQVAGEPNYPDCVYVTDLDVKRAQPGHVLQSGSRGKVEALTALLQGFEEVPCQELISWVTLEEPKNVKMYSTNHVWVEMGEPENMADKLRWTEAALNDLIARGENLGTLNVSSGRHADYAPQQ